jgi:hypothetical protein
MTREDIIRMAREAGLATHVVVPNTVVDIFEKFANLVAAHEREKVAQWMMERGYATGHGDTVEDLLKELEWQVAEREREGCAKWAELVAREIDNTNNTATYIASGIRARGEK